MTKSHEDVRVNKTKSHENGKHNNSKSHKNIKHTISKSPENIEHIIKAVVMTKFTTTWGCKQKGQKGVEINTKHLSNGKTDPSFLSVSIDCLYPVILASSLYVLIIPCDSWRPLCMYSLYPVIMASFLYVLPIPCDHDVLSLCIDYTL